MHGRLSTSLFAILTVVMLFVSTTAAAAAAATTTATKTDDPVEKHQEDIDLDIEPKKWPLSKEKAIAYGDGMSYDTAPFLNSEFRMVDDDDPFSYSVPTAEIRLDLCDFSFDQFLAIRKPLYERDHGDEPHQDLTIDPVEVIKLEFDKMRLHFGCSDTVDVQDHVTQIDEPETPMGISETTKLEYLLSNWPNSPCDFNFPTIDYDGGDDCHASTLCFDSEEDLIDTLTEIVNLMNLQPECQSAVINKLTEEKPIMGGGGGGGDGDGPDWHDETFDRQTRDREDALYKDQSDPGSVDHPTLTNILCRLIFSINAGYSGQDYLADILNLDFRVDAGHERSPNMGGRVLQRTRAEGREATYRDRRDAKIPAIERAMTKARKARGRHSIYAETSHFFAKTFDDIVLDYFLEDLGTRDVSPSLGDLGPCRVDVVILRRDFLDMACELYMANWTQVHITSLLGPWDRLASLDHVPAPNPGNTQEALEANLIFWYLYDTEAKAKAFADKYRYEYDYSAGAFWEDKVPGATRSRVENSRLRIHETWYEHLKTQDGINALLRGLDLSAVPLASHDPLEENQAVATAQDAIWQAMATEHERRSLQKRSVADDECDLSECPRDWLRERLEAFKEAIRASGTPAPNVIMTPPDMPHTPHQRRGRA